MNNAVTGRPRDRSWYEIRLKGRLEPRWASWFDGLALNVGDDGTTTLRGPVADQAALYGQLQRLRDLGLPLISVTQLEAPSTTTHASPDQEPGDKS